MPKVIMINRVAVKGTHAKHYAKKGKAADPCAVSLGHRGGTKGGPARALALPGSLRKKIASKAAEARWGRKSPSRKGEFKREAHGIGAVVTKAEKGKAVGTKAASRKGS